MAHTVSLKPEPSSADRGTNNSASTYPQRGGPNSKPNSTMLPQAEPGKGLGLPRHPPFPAKSGLHPVAGEWKVSPVNTSPSQTWRRELIHHKLHTFVEMLLPSVPLTTNWPKAGQSQQDLPEPWAYLSAQAKKTKPFSLHSIMWCQRMKHPKVHSGPFTTQDPVGMQIHGSGRHPKKQSKSTPPSNLAHAVQTKSREQQHSMESCTGPALPGGVSHV